MRRQSLAARLTLSHLGAALVCIVLLGGSLVGLIARSQRTQTLAAIQRQAQIYAAYATTLAPTTTALSAQAAAVVGRFPTTADVAVRMFAPNGAALFKGQLGEFPSSPVHQYVSGSLLPVPIGESSARRYAAEPVRSNGVLIGVVEVSQSTDRERALIRELLLTLLGAGSGAAVVALGLGAILARTLIRPLRAPGARHRHHRRRRSGGALRRRQPR